jgi:hypothetical protein
MKKQYKKPVTKSSERNPNLLPAAAMVAGFAAARAVVNAIKIDKLERVASLTPVIMEIG